MKKVYITLVTTLLFPILIYSQVNWVAQNSGTTASLDGVYFADENNGWIAGWGQIILHTTNGGETWGLQNTPVTSLHCIFFTDNQNGWASGLGGDVIHTTNGGETWIFQDNLDFQDIFKLYFTNVNSGWAAGGFFDYLSGSYGRAIYNTTDGGSSWNVQYDVTFETELKSIYFTDGSTGYAAGGTSIMKTTNGGNNWFLQQSLPGFSLRDIVFTNSNTGYVAGWYTGVPHYTSVFKTTDSGSSWNETALGTDEELSGLYFPDELNGWAAGVEVINGDVRALIYRTTNGGDNWVKQNIPPFDGLSQVFFVNDTKGWAVGSLGTILTTETSVPVELSSFEASADEGSVLLSWTTATEKNNKGFEVERQSAERRGESRNGEWEEVGFIEGSGTTTRPHSYSFEDKNLSAGTYSYRLKQIDLDGSFENSNEVEVSVQTPGEFALRQNYPNPFNPTTSIRYQIPASGLVSLKVYDVLGNEAAVLVNEQKSPGIYSVNFDASELASGVYVYQLRVNGLAATRKMLLLK